MDKIHEEFEKWFKCYIPTNIYFRGLKPRFFECWKASRESLVVELPCATFETPGGDNAFREDTVLDALESAGIKVVQK